MDRLDRQDRQDRQDRLDRQDRPPESGALHIGAVAQRTELSITTIRHYDEVGLVKPSGRSEGGFRLYTQPDIDRLLLIRRMKPLGFSLDEVAEVLSIAEEHERSPSQRTADALAEYVRQAIERRDRLARQLDAADEFIGRLGAIQEGTAARWFLR